VYEFFPESYEQARAKFLASAAAAGAELFTVFHPLRGRDGEALATDLARIGPRNATKALLVLSGTHGIEGYCGSGIQSAWMAVGSAVKPASDTAIFLAHAVNPYGFSWERRVDESNVDLNRNFIDFSQPLPKNLVYADLHHALCPVTWDEETLATTQAVIDNYAAEIGETALRQGVTGGQYQFPDGIFYGGQSPAWGRRTILDLVTQHLQEVGLLAVVDLHTGLGPHGYGERICDFPRGTRERTWSDEIYGTDMTCFYDGNAVSAELQGEILSGLTRALPDTLTSAVALEFGTVARPEVRLAIRADNWLHLNGELDSPKGRAIKEQIRAAFFPRTKTWCGQVTRRAFETFDLALRALDRA